MITLGIGTFICIVGCTFVVGGVVGLILTACLTAGRNKDELVLLPEEIKMMMILINIRNILSEISKILRNWDSNYCKKYINLV